MMTNVLIILSEEAHGSHATPNFPVVFVFNLPWLLFPMYIIFRMWRSDTPFSSPVAGSASPAGTRTLAAPPLPGAESR